MDAFPSHESQAFLGGDILTISITGADADSTVYAKLVAPTDDTVRHCTG